MNFCNPNFVLSQSFANSASLMLPTNPKLSVAPSQPGGVDTFLVGQWDSYSYQIFLTGSNANGTIYHRVSNNCAGFAPYQSQSINATNLNQDVFFGLLSNISQYAQLYWSGSGAGQVTASVSFYGRNQGGRR
jgi:hypothetical protein